MELRKKQFIFKAESGDENPGYHFSGYGSTYGNEDRDGDVILAGAFDEFLKNRSSVPLCLNHDVNRVIGRADLKSDENGLFLKGILNTDSDTANEVLQLIKMGALDSFSIGFFPLEFEPNGNKSSFFWESVDIKRADLAEVSVVTVPANPEALVTEVKTATKDVKKEIENAVKTALEKQRLDRRKKEILQKLED